MEVQQLIENFRRFLIAAWDPLDRCLYDLDWDSDPYFSEVWLQCNWELLVERMLLPEDQFLRPYGFGFDQKERFTKLSESSTHFIACSGKDFSGLAFQAFVTKESNALRFCPPFDYVELINLNSKEQITCPHHEVRFFLCAL